ncbi:MAG TPA: YafY family protein [Casimicrobiaceae bacterium]|nr:YafY family protein [Casimicrobiaceae bacterium]
MDRSERFYLIDRMLNERGLVTRQAFLDALEVSLATFKRDLEYMRERFNAPIVWNADLGGYQFATGQAGPRYALPGLWFSSTEIHALLTMSAMLDDLQNGLLSPHLEPLRARLSMLLEKGDVESAEVHKRVRVLRQAARTLPSNVFETVAAATLKRRRLTIRYAARSSKETSTRQVSPQRLVLYRDNWYLDAWCHLRNDLRKFSLDAMERVELDDEKAKSVDLKAIERTLGGGYGVFGGGDVQWATLRFAPSRARWVANERWHADQRGHIDAEGRYVLEVPFADPRELTMDVLKFGADVEVLAPSSLVETIAAEVKRMSARLKV